jgi:hypothetical protein
MGTAAMTLMTSCAAAEARAPSQHAPRAVIPSSEDAVFVVRVGEEVSISWNSEPGKLYTIVTKDRTRRNAEWQPVPGYVDMPGTGKMERVVLRVSPDESRAFNLKVTPTKSPVQTRP